MPQVLVLGVVRLAADLQRDVVGLGIVDLFVAALDVPLTPRGDDLQVKTNFMYFPSCNFRLQLLLYEREEDM